MSTTQKIVCFKCYTPISKNRNIDCNICKKQFHEMCTNVESDQVLDVLNYNENIVYNCSNCLSGSSDLVAALSSLSSEIKELKCNFSEFLKNNANKKSIKKTGVVAALPKLRSNNASGRLLAALEVVKPDPDHDHSSADVDTTVSTSDDDDSTASSSAVYDALDPLLAPSVDNMNGYSRKTPSKRRYEGSKYSGGSSHPKKKPRTHKERLPQPKNTVAMLNELRHGLIYKLESQTGPVHAPLFTIAVEVDGQKYLGHGRSKKIARIEAAATALRSFIQFKDGAVLTPLKPTCNLDFTSDDHLENNGTCNVENVKKEELVELVEEYVKKHAKELSIPNVNKSTITIDGQKKVPDKGPVMLLYELFNDVHFDCSTIDGAQNNCRFRMSVTVNSSKFDGTGPSKKLAKNAAAKAALASLCNISYSPMMHPSKNVALPIDDKSSSMELPQIHADTIGRLVLDKFMDVIKGQESYSRRKVLAGIVMTDNLNFNESKVISVSTGTKCVSGEHMSVNGAVLNDSHAEIVSRRCLVKYLYAQLELQCSQATANQSIFVRNTDNVVYPYKLKSGCHFHLYINTAPCGDARIFSPHENDTGVDKHPNRKARGQLRTKIESGEGTIPVKSSDGIQTWDGVLQGQRLLTMSCSDKIARWNIVGIQGSLLASIIEPIYLHSIVLGSLLHPEHMYRAVCGRIEKSIQGLPPPYHLNKPRLALVTSAEPRNQAKAPNFGINWTIGDSEVEVVNSLTGKTVNNQISRITKQTYFMKYGYLLKNLPGIVQRKLSTDYGETKSRVKDYQIAKRELFSAFRREDLGNWLKKPIEQDEFTVEV